MHDWKYRPLCKKYWNMTAFDSWVKQSEWWPSSDVVFYHLFGKRLWVLTLLNSTLTIIAYCTTVLFSISVLFIRPALASACSPKTQLWPLLLSYTEWYVPLGLDVGDGTNVVLGGQYELVVQHPLRLVVQTGGGVELDHLAVLHCQVVTRPLQVGNLGTGSNRSQSISTTHTMTTVRISLMCITDHRYTL